jgi:hypothetical protein
MKCECGCGGLAPVARRTDVRRGHRAGEPVRYLKGHNRRGVSSRPWAILPPRREPASLDDRLWPSVAERPTGCWEWTGMVNFGGYGYVQLADGTRRVAHRIVYELVVGLVPSGRQLDHLCRNRCCVNPAHLEPVTARENVRRGFESRNQQKEVGSA